MGNIDRYPTYKGGKVTEEFAYANYIGLRQFYHYVVNIGRWSPYEGGQLDRSHCVYIYIFCLYISIIIRLTCRILDSVHTRSASVLVCKNRYTLNKKRYCFILHTHTHTHTPPHPHPSPLTGTHFLNLGCTQQSTEGIPGTACNWAVAFFLISLILKSSF